MSETRRLRRAESFWGLHFDLHPNERDTDLGRDLTEEMVADLLRRTRPDYVQYDCKGHAGWTGYPTKVGWASPGIVKDSLAIWRKVTREHGVALYIHYSGVWDSVAVRQHPEWARIGPNFLPDKDMTSTYGTYVDDLLIPQLKELVDTYDLDGVWVDGECWAVRPDFSPAARAAFQQATGRTAVPEKAGAPGWPDLLATQRQQFESYVTHYVEALHAHAPAFQLTSNWMHSARMPLPVRAPLDFLSGDYTPGEAVNSARLEGRRFAAVREAQGINWDLMAWGFNFDPQARGERSLKPALQLMQEASIVLGQGGGYQIYFKPTRAGWIDEPTVDVAAEVGAFCRERQAVSHLTQSVPQVALLLSETAHFDLLDQQGALYSPRPLKPLEGVLHALLELHYSVDVLTEDQLLGEHGRVAEYPVMVVPEWHVLGTGVVDRLIEYVRRGGRLLVIGAAAAGLFKDHLSVRFDGEPGDLSAKSVRASLSGKRPMLAWTGTPWQAVALAGDSEQVRAVGRRFEQFNLRGEGEIASTLTRVGGGEIGAIYGPLGSTHYQFHHPATRAFIGEMMAVLFPEPVVEIDGPSSMDVSVRRKDGRTLVHLCNVTGMQNAPRYVCLDEVPPVGPIQVLVRTPQRPNNLTVIPPVDGFGWEWQEGAVRALVPRLEIHQVLVIE